MTMTRVKECDECAGVMRSVWHDGKTRVHAMKCFQCGHEESRHANKLTYIESRHFDVFEVFDTTDMGFGDFVDAFEERRAEATNEAFDDLRIAAVCIAERGGTYSVQAFESMTEPGEGRGRDENLPYGHPDVHWSTDQVFIGDSRLELEDVNGGRSDVYLRFVRSVEIERPNTPDEHVRVVV